ncbi:MAG: GFA family protein [Phenylobacterium sp.]
MLTGRCHCGAVIYEMPAETINHALCHCADCRRASGAPMVAWAMVPADQVTIDGATRIYASSEHGRRHFCEACGTGLFYTNQAVFPGLIDVQSATLDDPGALQPTAHIQVADRITWMATAHELPAFERYPG